MFPDANDYRREFCSVRRTLDVIGEKWTPLVLREAFFGARRFEEFLAGVGCARNLLSERLATLVAHGVLDRVPYREPGQRERHEYQLTEKGGDLLPVLTSLMQWGDRWEAGPGGGPVALACQECDEPVRAELRCPNGHRTEGHGHARATANPAFRGEARPSA